MQTFLPYRSFKRSVRCLDYRRLGKQRVEAFQILNALLGRSKGWQNHAATRMWRGYENALYEYMLQCCLEWVRRGYDGAGMMANIRALPGKIKTPPVYPPWLGGRKFHSSHRSNLLRKDPEWYGKFKWKETADLPYVWPVE